MDHYQTLGVAKNASPDEIKKAYRKLASQHHPDKGGDTQRFQEIQAAYDTLIDPEKRNQYDNPQPQMPQGGGFNFHFNGFDIHNNLFEQMFRQAFNQPQNRQQVYRTQVFINLDQVYHGGEQQLRLQTNDNVYMSNIQIPKGILDGKQVRYDNLIPNSSLIVEFRIHPHLKFDRRGADLICNQPVSVLELITGTTFQFTTISNKVVEVTIPPKTQPHMHLKLGGEGLPIMNTNNYGDQIILLKPFIPDTIDERVIQAINQTKSK